MSSLLRSLGILLGSGLVISALVSACDDEPQETLCDSGENIFCRCPGGEAGTKECQDDGESFGECFIDPATLCGERVECIEGEFVVCACPSGDIGQKECLRDEDGYGPCMLDSGEPCPFGTGPGATGPGGGGVGGMGEGGGTVGCAHGLCDNGDPLTADCDACAAAVCAADDYCCTQAWDSICVGLVDSECDNLCNPITECAHDPCVTGVALDSSCDPCVSAVCAADEVCCDEVQGEWDDICIDKVKTPTTYPACGGACCEHSECSPGIKLTADCSACAEAICGADAYCCNNQWDQYCVDDAEQNAACNCGGI